MLNVYSMLYALGSLVWQGQPHLNHVALIKKLYTYSQDVGEYSVSFWRQNIASRLAFHHQCTEYIYTDMQPYINGYRSINSSTWPYKGVITLGNSNAIMLFFEMKKFIEAPYSQKNIACETLVADTRVRDFLLDGPNDNEVVCYAYTTSSKQPVVGYIADRKGFLMSYQLHPITSAESIALSADNSMAVLGSDEEGIQNIVCAGKRYQNSLSSIRTIELKLQESGSCKKISWVTPRILFILSTKGSLYSLDIDTQKLYQQKIFIKDDGRKLSDFAINTTNPREFVFRDNMHNLYYGRLGACGITKPFFFKIKNCGRAADMLDSLIFNKNAIYIQQSFEDRADLLKRMIKVFDIR